MLVRQLCQEQGVCCELLVFVPFRTGFLSSSLFLFFASISFLHSFPILYTLAIFPFCLWSYSLIEKSSSANIILRIKENIEKKSFTAFRNHTIQCWEKHTSKYEVWD